ncbi:uncharacterized protein LOC105700977 [Orussus abietinus]|uniref:uncharacterized protein LOC105700977 n=1 Tax=Orussus abietinus TaxID=222816 RepID=UPI0006264D42|nr:uncharacterized protein LOC105700977 [Orussus abietinus]
MTHSYAARVSTARAAQCRPTGPTVRREYPRPSVHRPGRRGKEVSENCRSILPNPMALTTWLGAVALGVLFLPEAIGHGRLIEPPSRASMWRYGFDTPHDYNDNELYCGGFTRQWQRNSGKCGICGDPYDTPTPRPHESGGKFGNGVIVRRYRTGATIPVKVELTANHHGFFEFRVCPMTAQGLEVTQECLDEYLLQGENGTARYYPGPGNRVFEGYYKLPEDLTCVQCVFQWRYTAANNWGDCGNGTGAVGCGPQEEFRGCADIAIGDEEATLPPRTSKPETSTSETAPGLPDERESGPIWLYGLVITGTCLLVAFAASALLYTYYYHSDRAKKWLMAKKLFASKMPPVAPPRHKRHGTAAARLQV